MTRGNVTRMEIREPDVIIEGELPLWKCDGTRKRTSENIPCSEWAQYMECHITLGGRYSYLQCRRHREERRGMAITANHTHYWIERLPTRWPVNA